MPADQLQTHLSSLDAGVPFQTAWSVLDFRTGQRWNSNGRACVPAASTRKIAILMTCLQQIHAGALKLDEKIKIEAWHQQNDSGILRFLRPGLIITLYDALVLMIVVSDNACTAAIVEKVGLAAISAFCKKLGMEVTRHVASAPSSSFLTSPTPDDLTNVNVVAPDEMILLLSAIAAGISDESAARRLGINSELCRMALLVLSQQQLTQGLPRLLPTGTVVSHKTGSGPSNESDAGIVFQNERPLFAIAVYTHHNPIVMPDGSAGRTAARDHIASISFCCWKHLAD